MLISSKIRSKSVKMNDKMPILQVKEDISKPNDYSTCNNCSNKLTSRETFFYASIDKRFSNIIRVPIDLFSVVICLLALYSRFYKLHLPNGVVFDELHYGRIISYYIRRIFFFDHHPPLGKQIIAAIAYGMGFDGNFTVGSIGAAYTDNVPVFWLRFIPALCGSILPMSVYHLMQEMGISRWCSFLGGLLIVLDNALLIQSRHVLIETQLLLFSIVGLYLLIKFHKTNFLQMPWIIYGIGSACLLTCAISVKYVGILTYVLALYLLVKNIWNSLYDTGISNLQICIRSFVQFVIFTILPVLLYLLIFYVHLQTLYRAGPHDNVMTSAFQASLEGGLASITEGQPMKVAHGSQITLRHSYGRTCWLHSHIHVYPVRYLDKRGSSHQQQVTCYSFKDVNNWWLVKRPHRDDLVVDPDPDVIVDGDIIQLIHGITSRALNSHDVAAPMTPLCQEVSCYIDYDINMKAQLLWRVNILNKATEGPIWHAIRSEVRLIHESTGAVLRFTGRQLPEWGFNQHEVAADRHHDQKDTIWNVEEHRYTKVQDEQDREQQLLKAEMLPMKRTSLTFYQKFMELQTKMLWHLPQINGHMYSSEPLDWPLLTKGIAYWVDANSSGQIHLIGNILIWYTSTLAIFIYITIGLFYVIRRRRKLHDISDAEWQRFINVGHVYFIGYLMHYLPYFFTERVLFLHHYFPAFLFKLQLLCYVIEHIDYLLQLYCNHRYCFRYKNVYKRYLLRYTPEMWLIFVYRTIIICWFFGVVTIYIHFLSISYGIEKLTIEQISQLRWKDTWDFVQHNNLLTI